MRCLLPTLCALSTLVLAAQAPPRDELGRSVKLGILVDKVMQPEHDWVTEEWMIRETAAAGFNVYSPRHGYDRLDDVRQVTEWCAKYGIYHLPWMRGTLTAPAGAAAEGKRLVWAGGAEQLLWSPNSDEFWDWTTRYIVAYAKLSAELPNLLGVFLDYENYAPGKPANCYSLSYDRDTLDRFAAAQGVEVPELEPAQRQPWLDEHQLHDAFAAWQTAHWRERCRALRRLVDEQDPRFQFCIYPAPGTPFMVDACYPEWSTPAAPLILADPWTYGRSSRFLPQDDALEANRQTLLRGLEVPKAAGIPFVYTGGIDPVVRGADPEFCGKNAVMISELTDGYWVFYEGPKYKLDHPAYFQWFTWANEAIAAGRLAAWHEPREEPEDFGLNMLGQAGKGLRLTAPPVTGAVVQYPLVHLRGEHLLLVAAEAGQPVELVLRHLPVGNYASLLAWALRDPALPTVTEGTVQQSQTGTVAFTPAQDGVYLLAASAGSCAWAVVQANAPVAVLAEGGVAVIHGAERLYFQVPAGLDQFRVTARGAGAETVRLDVLDPTGRQVASGQTTTADQEVSLQVEAGAGGGGGTWSLRLGKADEGVLEDSRVILDPALPPALALVPEQAFGLAPDP